ncbi:hypothetical protein A6046_05065 [[Haemophilus] ducreyi]|uniref:Glycosyl transferase family 25 domain-containing protein n=1 Tax=Haemophilus ducreyi TaxID=730 RepID=A0AAC8UBK0_HAEDC|nr:glycosyltransferase family 25 protein [[Haemophilus] ducreyi]AKO31972.1 hypothetical protein RZ57_01860 [[Haemophilus] ducreyi]AKO33427.1 hypothetical protein RZ58_01860 [[Haemophilus] ducreyi]ANF59848.1 hypothetical protein A6036_00315 [[Haemophilus] ducreyi]ANF63165.1 hypothetical protein A6038_02945 [[Haemophilus] ducreyi]ANF65222.1 hypothetical protein A6039_06450 [[Haemophilus] ducreyi]
MQNIHQHNYVISLKTADARRQHIIQEFAKHNIPFQFFDACSIENNLYMDIEKHLPMLLNSKLSNSEKGCLMSHFLLWKKCVLDDIPYMTIFEDDIILSDESNEFISDYSWVNNRFYEQKEILIKFETFLMPVIRKFTKINEYKERAFNQLISRHFGTASYLISKEAAKYLILLYEKLPADELIAVDESIFNVLLNDKNLCVYQLEPAICVQELQFNKENSLLVSQIEEDRYKNQKQNKPRKTLKQRIIKVCYNINRIFKKIKKTKLSDEKDINSDIVKFK